MFLFVTDLLLYHKHITCSREYPAFFRIVINLLSKFLSALIECLGTGSCLCFSLLGAWRKKTEAKAILFHFKGKTAAFVIVRLSAKLGIFLRVCLEPVLEAGVKGVDDEDIARLVKEDFRCFMRFFHFCYH